MNKQEINKLTEENARLRELVKSVAEAEIECATFEIGEEGDSVYLEYLSADFIGKAKQLLKGDE